MLSCVYSLGYDKILVAYDMPALSPLFDFMNVMAYDYNGAWNK